MKVRKFTVRSLAISFFVVLAFAANGTLAQSRFRAKTLLGRYDGVVGLAASANLDDSYLIALVATRSGDVHEIYYTESAKGGDSVIAHYGGIVGIAAFYNKDDQYRIAIVATSDGDVHEVFYHPTKGRGESVVGHFNDIVGIAGFFADDDQNRIVIVATRDGAIHELFYNPNGGKGESVIARQAGVVAVSANYGSGAHADDRSVVLLTSSGETYQLRYHPTRGLTKQKLLSNNGTISLASTGQEIFTISGGGQLRDWSGGTSIAEDVIDGIQGVQRIAVGYNNAVNLICSTSDGNVYFLAPRIP
jgi:hypothetical protein